MSAILEVLHANARLAARTVVELASKLPEGDCPCHHALEGAIISDPGSIPAEARERLRVIAGKYL